MNPHPSATEPVASAIVVAAGSSTRMRGSVRKPFLQIAGRALIEHACAALASARSVSEIVVVGHAEDLDKLRELVRSSPDLAKVSRVVAGGAQRVDSVRAGVAAASLRCEILC